MVAGEYWAELTGSVELPSTSGKGNKVKKITEKMKTIEEYSNNLYDYLQTYMAESFYSLKSTLEYDYISEIVNEWYQEKDERPIV